MREKYISFLMICIRSVHNEGSFMVLKAIKMAACLMNNPPKELVEKIVIKLPNYRRLRVL
jgi:hypothetical protein